MAVHKVIGTVLRPIWRMRRGLTLGAQGCVVDEVGRVLLVKHGYRPGWHFPGGGVEWGESTETALGRELHEETGVEVTGPVELHGLFTNFEKFPGDHIAFYLVKQWRRIAVPLPNAEIVASGFYRPDALPEGIAEGAIRRVAEVFSGAKKLTSW